MNLRRDGRSKRAIAIDKALQASRIYPNTPEGIAKWMKHKGSADLQGYDTSRQTRIKQRWNNTRRAKTEIESIDHDLYDTGAYTDSSLSYNENKMNKRRQMNDFMRF